MTRVLFAQIMLLPRALRLALGSRRAIAGTLAVFLIVGFVYAMILPATDTGGIVGLVSLRFLTAGSLALAILMASLLALTVALAVFGFRNGARVSAGKGASGAVLAIIPSLFCCSPILPLTVAAIAAILPTAGATALPIQGFIATHETWLYAVAIVLMIWGLYGSAQRILCCKRHPSRNSERPRNGGSHECCEDPFDVVTNPDARQTRATNPALNPEAGNAGAGPR